eukprot:3262641-Pyramimonas_sp.AAC.1
MPERARVESRDAGSVAGADAGRPASPRRRAERPIHKSWCRLAFSPRSLEDRNALPEDRGARQSTSQSVEQRPRVHLNRSATAK